MKDNRTDSIKISYVEYAELLESRQKLELIRVCESAIGSTGHKLDSIVFENATLKQENAELKDKVEDLSKEVTLLKKIIYGSKSEKTPGRIETLPAGQMSLFEALADSLMVEIDSGIALATNITDEPKTKKKTGRRKVAVNIPTRVVVIEAPEYMRVDENGEPLTLLGYLDKVRLDIIPGRAERVNFKVEVWGYADSREVVHVAPDLDRIIPKGKLTDQAIETIVFEKFFDGMPLYRQLKNLNAQGADFSKSTMSDAVMAFADFYRPLTETIKRQIFASHYVHADETPLKYGKKTMKKGKNSQEYKQGYVYIYQGMDQAYFHYGGSRSQSEIMDILGSIDLDGYLGFLMCDAYAGYNRHKGSRLACWAHARRKFFEQENNGNAQKVVRIINKLYGVEKKAKIEAKKEGLTHSQFLERLDNLRQIESVAILVEIKEQLELFSRCATPESRMGKAIEYVLKRWESLKLYTTDPTLPIDNNAAERSLRSVVVGRKNWLFAGSINAGKAAAVCYTIMESCRLQGIDPRAYMRAVTPILTDPNRETSLEKLTPKALGDKIRIMPKNL